jgi:hypothetical protein
LLDPRRDGAHDFGGYLLLQVENIFECTVEPIGPEMHACGSIDQLAGNAHLVPRFAHAPFEDIAHPELTPNLLHVHRAPLVGEAGITGDDEQLPEPRQRGNDFFDHTISEILLLQIATQVLEGQHGD